MPVGTMNSMPTLQSDMRIHEVNEIRESRVRQARGKCNCGAVLLT